MADVKDLLWHAAAGEALLEKMSVSIERGVASQEISERQMRFGRNVITQKKGTHPIVLFLLQFNQPLVYILLVAALVTALLAEWVDSGVILGVVLINAVIGFVQESKALKAIESLAKSVASSATVIRDGKKQKINAADIVVGDIVILQSGDKVPADMRLLKIRELQADESALTGESLPVAKDAAVLELGTVLADRKNMVYSSTLITYGVGTGVVVSVGDKTEIGRINKMIASADVLATPLTKQVGKFSKWLLYVILGLAAITFAVGVMRGESVINMFMAAVALAVGAIPEGLPAALTITLAIGVSKMAKRNAIIRKLPAVETLGSTSIICSDKTGTLTQNQMTVQKIFAAGEIFDVTGIGYASAGEIMRGGSAISSPSNKALVECLRAGLLCNDSAIVSVDGNLKVEGDPTEAALIASAAKGGFTRDALEQEMPRIDAIPFESQYQYMATLHSLENSESNVVYMKGSVESIVSRCAEMISNDGTPVAIDATAIRSEADGIAAEGLRVLAFAKLVLKKSDRHITHATLDNKLTFLGLQAMIDPPREEAIRAVAACKSAGISVKMITGDHELTAFAIAKRIGIIEESAVAVQCVLSGKAISAMSDDELAAKAAVTSVFARVAPEDKLRLVKALQRGEAVIAMTGDGVNDAPALRQANIGIAMGITGTDVSKEAADMVLTDDNFATIEAAVEEGRGVYDNLTKFITWTLPTNFGEGLVILAAIIAGVALPILPVQILWINMTTAVFLGLMLAFEPKELGIMNRPPREPRKPILTSQLIFRIGIVGAILCAGSFGLFEWAISSGRSEAEARTLTVNVFVLGELFYLFNCRSLKYSFLKVGAFTNGFLIFGVLFMLFIQILYTHLPIMNTAFQSSPIDIKEWLLCAGVGSIIYFVIEIEKYIGRKRGKA